MTISRQFPSSPEQRHTPRGGTLAPHSLLHGGPFLFTEQGEQLGAQFTDAGRGSLPYPTGAGAAIERRALMLAKSRPLPFSEINHVAHVRIYPCETLFTAEAFA